MREAANIIFNGHIPQQRPQDTHDILGTWRIVSDPEEMKRTPQSFPELLSLLRDRHAMSLNQRPDKNPGQFKMTSNHAGTTTFVAPNLIESTLEQGFQLYRSLETLFQRAE